MTYTAAGAWLQDVETSLRRGQLPAPVFNDPEIHALECDRIFGRAWVFVGHESEVPTEGDYCARYIGNDNFIFVRDEHARVRVMFNACRHRGTQICRVERGNAAHFRCPYHGWTYSNTGQLLGMPAARAAGVGIDKDAWALLEAPAVESFHGFVFASLSEDAPPLRDYLGEYTDYLDLLVNTVGELEVVGSPHRWTINGNWKSGAENLAGDDYHGIFLHRSMFDVSSSGVTLGCAHARLSRHDARRPYGHDQHRSRRRRGLVPRLPA
jgi:PAH dioxygenase large subunit